MSGYRQAAPAAGRDERSSLLEVGGYGLAVDRNRSPGSHPAMRRSRSVASAFFSKERSLKAAFALLQAEM